MRDLIWAGIAAVLIYILFEARGNLASSSTITTNLPSSQVTNTGFQGGIQTLTANPPVPANPSQVPATASSGCGCGGTSISMSPAPAGTSGLAVAATVGSVLTPHSVVGSAIQTPPAITPQALPRLGAPTPSVRATTIPKIVTTPKVTTPVQPIVQPSPVNPVERAQPSVANHPATISSPVRGATVSPKLAPISFHIN